MTAHQHVDLTNCDREPIHIPGSIQPHGSLLACDASAGTVLRHSQNVGAMLGIEGDPNGRSLSDLIGSSAAHDIRNALSRTPEGARSSLLFGQRLENGRRYDVAVHRFKGNAVLEFEPASEEVAQPLELARAMLGRISAIDTPERLIRDTARLVQGMLGYDRVMIYQFGQDGAGKVMAEAKRADLESFLGQYFPSSDIPQQARALYLKNTIRIISDANFERIPVVPALDASGEPLDLSFAHLRSVSPIHCEYLRNMGVGASMSISVIVDGALWGMIACHHYAPRTLSMAQRVAAEMFGEFFSLHLSALRHRRSLEVATAARAALDSFLSEAVGAADINQLMRDRVTDFAQLIPADGVVLWINGTATSIGTTAPDAVLPGLARFAETVAEGRVWATHKLSNVLAGAEDYASQVSGVLIVPISQRPRDFLFFFRRELVQTLDWAGNPDKTYEVGPLGDRLTPRKSFAIWKETVHHQSAPWTDQEREFAEATRAAMVGVILQHSELLADERAKADVRQRMLNEELNHRVKNILAVIKSLVTSPNQDGQSLADYVDSLRGRIQALSLAHDQVIRGDGGGSLLDLLNAELSPYQTSSATITLTGPNTWMDARSFSIMALVFHELSTNAAKYGALSRPGGELKVEWKLDAVGACDIVWQERKGPEVRPPSRRGFGTVLVDRSIPFDLGGESNVDYHSDGVTARFRIPPRFVSNRAQLATVTKVHQPAAATDFSSLKGKNVLIVEDQMLIALDLEQILTDSGMNAAATATSLREALVYLGRERPDCAVLDVNLGEESSAPIARHLIEAGIPFIFATGYGERGSISAEFEGVPVVRKPYDTASILTQLRQVLS
ncbi:Bacteriophytochrome (light-regulated signal transduction histidine kinase) [Devosia crocina]|uniref:histidine kinase n=1 Tax=Devosia crocina TaxID=429728 RepID=A0A1I7N2V5_9HYPH|nr:HWE histidine kinase domain-containing protein [Devosia crocina]SFV28963.1 Bacteriophytochrome (light-regulated signal transduction histidine kinase) [Devosia crocina]